MQITKNKEPLVSVVMANFNYGSYLKQAVQSVIQQTYQNIEFLFIDDSSSDNSKGKILDMKKKNEGICKMYIEFLDRNVGLNGALNYILPKSNGDIIIMLDSDDWLPNEYVEIMIKKLINANLKDSKTKFAYSDSMLVNKKGKKLGKGKSLPFDHRKIEITSYIPRPSPIFKDILLSILPLNEHIRVRTKHEMWKSIIKRGWKGEYVKDTYFFYRMHEKNLSGIGEKILDNLILPEEIHLNKYWDGEHLSQFITQAI